MTTATCQCGQPAKDSTLCTGCARELDLALLAAVTLGPDLDIALAKQARFADKGRGGRGRAAPLPYDQRASDAARELRVVLDRWVGLLRGGEDWPADALDARAMWLLQRGSQWRQHAHAASMQNHVAAAVRRAMRVIDRPPDRVYAGPCPGCGADVLAKPGEQTATCRGCGQTHDIAVRQAQMRADLEDLTGSPRWCAMMARGLGWPVTDSAAGMWATRRKLTPTAAGAYRLGDVLDLAAARDTKRPA